MPEAGNPSTTTAQNINTEIGVPATTQIDLTNNWVRNVACEFGTTAVSYGDARWGINFWGGTLSNVIAGTLTWAYPRYNLNANLIAYSTHSGGKGIGNANSSLTLFANGVLRIGVTRGVNTAYQHRTWLTSGVAGDYTANYAVVGTFGAGRGLTVGTLNTNLALSTDRTWAAVTSSGGGGLDTEGGDGNLIITATTGGAELIRRRLALYSSASSANPTCPTCCFTPETLITMGDLTTKRIADVVIGDTILSYNEEFKKNIRVAVDTIISPSKTSVYEYTFEDGNKLRATDDHPLFVVGKGYSAIKATTNYKDLKTVKTIEIDDKVVNEDGKEKKIVGIKPFNYSDKVYTFGTSRFYANGVLVY